MRVRGFIIHILAALTLSGVLHAAQVLSPDELQTSDTTGGWAKYRGNPVLGGQLLGMIFDSCVVKENDKYRMWFSWRPRHSIGMVESRNGVNWSAPKIALAPNPLSGWEEEVNRPCVVRRPDGYHMWYTGLSRGHSNILAATSADGIEWTRVSPQPVMKADQVWEKVAVMSPSVLWSEADKCYHMWYSGGQHAKPDAIGYATSPDGTSWTKHAENPVFAPTGSSTWDGVKIAGSQVVTSGPEYLMFYMGIDGSDTARIGLARSPDGIRDWQRFPQNPIIRPAAEEQAWDHDSVYRPFALHEDAFWMLWYNARRGTTHQIGLAVHDGDDLWTAGASTTDEQTSETTASLIAPQ